MNGDGWVCDECGATLVLPVFDRFAMNGMAPPPGGWYDLRLSAGVPAVAAEQWHFCDIECVMNHATKKEAYEARLKSAVPASTSQVQP